MLSRQLIIDDPEHVRESLQRRNEGADTLASFERLRAVIDRRRAVQAETDGLRAERNALSKQIGGLMKEGRKDEAETLKATVKTQADRLAQLEAEWKILEAEEDALLLVLPNLLDERVPPGTSAEDNQCLRTWGEPKGFDFEPRAHDDLATSLGIYDADRASKLSGARFSVLYGLGARLERALANFFLDRASGAFGYTEVSVPLMVSRSTMTGTGQLPKFEKDLFKLALQLEGQDAFLIPTAEVPVTNLRRDEILEASELPLRYCCWTPCFRSEAGSYGKDTRGLIRQHQFYKVELVKITSPETSAQEHEELTRHAGLLLEELGLAHRVMVLSGGDIGFGAKLCYDIEVWLPGQAAYREISSCSNYGDFQARRMQLRMRPEPGAKPVFCHTINGSGLPVGRTLVAILENYQQKDGSVLVPKVLQPYMGGVDRIPAR